MPTEITPQTGELILTLFKSLFVQDWAQQPCLYTLIFFLAIENELVANT
jgi:hypothetical protein